jgi:serine/threonine protein kinase/Tol biopolymer transport system component
MKSDRWYKIEEVFHAALQRKPEDRANFLNQSCAGDTSLYDDVKALLTSNENDDSFFEDSASALAAEMFTDRVGETIGPYEILSQLGSGAMGVVYLAQDVRLGRKIALKLLPSQFTNDKDRLRRFQQEARAASALNHPNILTVYEVEQRDRLHYIATEFVDGVTLRQHMQARQMSLDEVLAIAVQVASALQAAHAAGIAHRDIKPENIMIRSDGYIKVLDFGLAKLTENELSPASAETNPGVVMGTPRYMSPEQARGLDVDLRTDIFSLGTVIYELVTGKLPFEGETTSDVIAALIKDEPEPMRTTVPDLPVEFEQVVSKALVKDRGLRYQTVGELSSALQGLKDKIKLGAFVHTNDDSLDAQTIKTRTATDPQAKQKTERVSLSKGWTLTIALGLIVIVGVVTVLSFRRRSPSVKDSPSVKEKIEETSSQLSNRDGFISSVRFAPDGKRVIYSAGFDGKPLELFYNNGEAAESRSAGIESASLKSVSRSGKIAVLVNFELNWSDGYNGTLQILPAGSVQPEVTIEGVDDAAFAPDDTFAILRTGLDGEQRLEYPANTVLYKSPGWMSYPRFSPKGDKIAFFEHPVGDFSGLIAVFDLASKTKIDISTDWQALKGLAWNPKTDEIWFGGSKESKTVYINKVSLSGQLQKKLYGVSGQNARVEDISDDGRILITQGTNHTTMMMLHNKSPGEVVHTPGAWSTSADISPDGKTLLFYQWGYESSDGSDVSGVYLQRLDSSEPVKLGPGKALALSPDGKWALALKPTRPQPQLILLPTSQGQPKPLANPRIKEYYYASFFPDGSQILFTGVEARDQAVIRSFVQDVKTGQVHPLTEEGTTALRVSPDGKRVITLQPDKTFYIQGLDGGEPHAIPGLERYDEPIQWSDDGRAVFVKAAGDFVTKIYRVDLATGERREWKDIDPPNKIGNVGLEVNSGGILITPDGKVCIYTYWILIQQILSASIN